MSSKDKGAGFTIVELLIVVVVIAILASISIVAFTSIQRRASNAARVSEVRKMKSLIDQYLAINGAQSLNSLVPTWEYFCLGEGYIDVDPGPGTSCYHNITSGSNGSTISYSEPTSASLNAALRQVGDYSAGAIPAVERTTQYVSGGVTYSMVTKNSAPQLYRFDASDNTMVDGKPAYAQLYYMLDGPNVDCGVRPVLSYVNTVGGVYNYTAQGSAINSGGSDTYTLCTIYIPDPS